MEQASRRILTVNDGSSSIKFALFETVDSLVFAGGIGENAPSVRARTCDALGFLGVELDSQRNEANEGVISVAAGRVTVRVIHTDEERMIAQAVCGVLGLGRRGGH